MNPSAVLIGLPLAAAPIVYLLGRVTVKLKRPASAARWTAIAIIAALWVMVAIVARDADSAAALSLGEVAFQIDPISLLIIVTALTLVTPSLIYSLSYISGAAGEEKYYAAVIVMTGSMIGLVSTGDLFNLWVWFELLTISSYLLVMFHGERSLEAGVKYIVQSAIGSAFVLLGIALVLMQTGTLNLAEIQGLATANTALLAAGALLVVGFGVKIALVPMHTWLPDAHSQAPSTISALLSGIVIEVALIALLRALAALSGVTATWGTLLMAFGALNMLGGNLLALRQTQVKRLLAYSSISQVGYLLLGLGITMSSGEAAGAQGAFFHLFAHALGKGLAFLAAGAFMTALGTHSLNRDDLAGASRRYPLLSLAFTLSLLSLAGLPPLAGFMSKWQIFVAGFATQDSASQWLVVFAALNSLLSLGYYMPLINRLYREEMTPQVANGQAVPVTMLAPVLVLALLIVVLGVAPHVAAPLTEPAGQALSAAFGG